MSEMTPYQFQTGDIIAFAGNTLPSKIIQWYTKSPISHVGVIQAGRTSRNGCAANVVYESTSRGLHTSSLGRLLREYEGKIWHLQLDEKRLRGNVDRRVMNKLDLMVGRRYDWKQALFSALDIFELDKAKNDFKRVFCSEVAAATIGAALGVDVNASEATPADVCRWKIYSRCEQLKGASEEIEGFNTKDLA